MPRKQFSALLVPGLHLIAYCRVVLRKTDAHITGPFSEQRSGPRGMLRLITKSALSNSNSLGDRISFPIAKCLNYRDANCRGSLFGGCQGTGKVCSN